MTKFVRYRLELLIHHNLWWFSFIKSLIWHGILLNIWKYYERLDKVLIQKGLFAAKGTNYYSVETTGTNLKSKSANFCVTLKIWGLI